MTATEPATARRRRSITEWRVELKVVPLVLILLLIASAGLATWLYLSWYRPDQQTDDGVAHAAVAAASEGTVAILTYTPKTFDADVDVAKSHLTGGFLSYYDEFIQTIVAPAAKGKAVSTTATVVGAAVQELHPDSAAVLVFVNQSTTSTDKPDPSMAASSVLVTLAKVGDAWLISKFDPV